VFIPERVIKNRGVVFYFSVVPGELLRILLTGVKFLIILSGRAKMSQGNKRPLVRQE